MTNTLILTHNNKIHYCDSWRRLSLSKLINRSHNLPVVVTLHGELKYNAIEIYNLGLQYDPAH